MRVPPHAAVYDASLKEHLEAIAAYLHPDLTDRRRHFYQFETPRYSDTCPHLLLREYRREDALPVEKNNSPLLFPRDCGGGVYIPEQECLAHYSTPTSHRLLMVDVRATMILTGLTVVTTSESLDFRRDHLAYAIAKIPHEHFRRLVVEEVMNKSPSSYVEFLQSVHRLHRGHTHLFHRLEVGFDCSFFEL